MHCAPGKKINASLLRIQGVGGKSKKEKKKDAKLNALDILAKLLPSKGDTAQKLITEKCGQLRYMYYKYMENFHVRPLHWDDMINGIIHIAVTSEVKELYRE